MKQNEMDILEDSVTEVLLSNGTFYRNSPDDESSHYIDVVTIGALAHDIIQFAVNVFKVATPLIAGGRWVYGKFFQSANDTNPNLPNKPEKILESVSKQANKKEKLGKLRSNARNPEVRKRLAEDIEKILDYHGWPLGEAGSDANQIVDAIIGGNHVQSE